MRSCLSNWLLTRIRKLAQLHHAPSGGVGRWTVHIRRRSREVPSAWIKPNKTLEMIMSKYRNALPQLGERLFLTDGGLETTLIFMHGIDLPYFASCELLRSQA